MNDQFKFELGDTVKELISGMSGVIVCRSEYLTGCNRYGIQPRGVNEKKQSHEWAYSDEHMLCLTKHRKVVPNIDDSDNTQSTGGPTIAGHDAPNR